MKKLISIFTILILLSAFACKENKILSVEKSKSQIVVNTQDLNNLGEGYWYELWIVYEEGGSKKRQSAGVFTVDDNGGLSTTEFDVKLGYMQLAKAVLLSIEDDMVPGMDTTVNIYTADSTVIDTTMGPSKYRVLTAGLHGNDGLLTPGSDYDQDLFKFDFTSAQGFYMLSTPTDSNNTEPKRGLWFTAKDTADKMIAGLDLPVLPANWKYEGRVYYNGNTLSTGLFSNPEGADESNIFSDVTGTAFPFPGEDFIHPDTVTTVLPNDLTGLEIGVNIIPPYPANAAAPFSLVPFTAVIPANAAAGQVYEMINNSAAFPAGQLNIKIEIYE